MHVGAPPFTRNIALKGLFLLHIPVQEPSKLKFGWYRLDVLDCSHPNDMEQAGGS